MKRLPIRIPASALKEFEEVERSDWSNGITLEELLSWVNAVAARFRPAEVGDESRASEEFSPRTFRHYQTLGCIDSPERAGRHAVYRFRHYVQALLLRKLIWERVPSERIAGIMANRSTEETKRLLFDGIEIVARQSAPEPPIPSGVAESWKRIPVVSGLELHVRADFPKPKPAQLTELLSQLETALRRNL